MTDMVIIESEVGEDGKLNIQLPADAPRGRVRVTVETVVENPAQPSNLSPEEQKAWEATYDPEFEALLNDPDLFNGQGLTTEEIANSPVFGIWSDRTDITDSAEFVSEMRRKRRERRQNRYGD